MTRSSSNTLLLALLLATATLGGCFVEGRCFAPEDCATNERCLSGACVACRTAAECAAIVDRNPDSSSYGEEIELIAFRGDVVLVYLANAT